MEGTSSNSPAGRVKPVENQENPRTLPIYQRELLARLGWFIRVRWAMASFALAALLVAWRVLDVEFILDGRELLLGPLACIGAILGYNVIFHWMVRRLKQRPPLQQRRMPLVAMAQIACDLLGVGVLVLLTGGAANFFLLLILLPVVIATELLSRPLAIVSAALAVLIVNLLVWGPHSGLLPQPGMTWGGHFVHFHAGGDRSAFDVTFTLAASITIFLTAGIASAISAQLRRREGELELTYHQLAQADQAKSFFMRKAGHEMRAPLVAIYAILEAIREEKSLPPARVELMDRARQRLHGLMRLVDDLRHYSRLKAPQMQFQPAAVDLAQVVTATVDLFRQRSSDAGIALACRVEPVTVSGDEEMLREVVTNLVTNAVQYTPPGGSIDVDLSARDGRAVLAVIDTGIGVSASAGQQIFADFYRAPEAKAVFPEGTGLGLAICRRIADLHGGQITAEANSPTGSRFTLVLPRA